MNNRIMLQKYNLELRLRNWSHDQRKIRLTTELTENIQPVDDHWRYWAKLKTLKPWVAKCSRKKKKKSKIKENKTREKQFLRS